MFTATSTYFFLLFILVWGYCGYLLVLLIFSALNPRNGKAPKETTGSPSIAVIIPCYNEEALVQKKVENLRALDYEAGKAEVYFVNGLSTDATGPRLRAFIEGTAGWHCIESGKAGKIHQLNHLLSTSRPSAEILVFTDMDAMLEPGALKGIAEEFASNERIAVVGANISPDTTMSIEESLWQDQNLFRIMESSVYTSSIVVAPCYAVKASFFDQFPEDCVADDIYVAFKANSEGMRTAYVESIKGTEVRCPTSTAEFFRHKFRKGNAYLIELFRFLYRLPHMPGWWKIIYLTKLLQFAVIPWLLPYFLLSTISFAMSGRGQLQIAGFGMGFLFLAFLITSAGVSRCRAAYARRGNMKKKRRDILVPFIVSNLIMIIVGLSFPFYKQSSIYAKIGKNAS